MKESIKTNDTLYQYFLSEYNNPFAGWDFSHICERMITEKLNWDYKGIIMNYANTAETMLDMGTGGGEFLSSIMPLQCKTIATESYKPNIKVAKERLEPMGVTVLGIDNDESLPIESDFFDLIINRHESYSTKEVYRILKSGGKFITQQVGGLNDIEINILLGAPATIGYDNWCLDYAVKELEGSGFKVLLKKEQSPVTTFYDIGAILYYLKAIPWQVSDFNIEKYYDKLIEIKQTIDNKGKIEIKSERFLLIAEKPLE